MLHRSIRRTAALVLLGMLVCSTVALAGCGSRTGLPTVGAGTPTQGTDNTNGKGTEYVSKYGFAFRYGQLMLDAVPSGDQFIELKHLSGDTAVVKIQKPDALYGDPVEWLKTAYANSDYKTYVLDRAPLNGYPAVRTEFSWTVMKVPIRTIIVTAYKDGYFFSLIVTMKEAYVDDTRKEFDKVVASFRLLPDKIDLEAMAPWKEQLPKGFPITDVPLFAVDEIQTASGTALDVNGGYDVFYSSNGVYAEIIAHYEDVLAGATALEVDKGEEKTTLQGVTKGMYIEVEINYYKTLESCNVAVRVRKA